MVSNGPPRNYCKASNEHIIGHVLVGKNGGSVETLVISLALAFSNLGLFLLGIPESVLLLTMGIT